MSIACRRRLARIPEDRRAAARLVFTAHTIPAGHGRSAATKSSWWRPPAASARAGHDEWDLVWQSRSGPPSQPWLEPDILDHLRTLATDGVTDVVLSPIGFISDHMEVIYDLDYEAARRQANWA